MNKNFPPPPAAPMNVAILRYSATAQALHWLTALLMFAVLPLGWVMTSLAQQNPNRDALFTLHKSIGVTILLVTIVRIAWRAANPPPALPASLPRWEAMLAKLSHWLLYTILLVMPVSGYILSSAGGHPVSFFRLFELPALPHNKGLANLGEEVHLLVQWAVYALIALHLVATAWHVVLRRDGVLERILPVQRVE